MTDTFRTYHGGLELKYANPRRQGLGDIGLAGRDRLLLRPARRDQGPDLRHRPQLGEPEPGLRRGAAGHDAAARRQDQPGLPLLRRPGGSGTRPVRGRALPVHRPRRPASPPALPRGRRGRFRCGASPAPRTSSGSRHGRRGPRRRRCPTRSGASRPSASGAGARSTTCSARPASTGRCRRSGARAGGPGPRPGRRAARPARARRRRWAEPETIRVAFIRIDFAADRGGGASTGDGRFDLSVAGHRRRPRSTRRRTTAPSSSATSRRSRATTTRMSYGRVVVEGDVWPRERDRGLHACTDMADYGPWTFSQTIYGAAVRMFRDMFFAADSQSTLRGDRDPVGLLRPLLPDPRRQRPAERRATATARRTSPRSRSRRPTASAVVFPDSLEPARSTGPRSCPSWGRRTATTAPSTASSRTSRVTTCFGLARPLRHRRRATRWWATGA